MDSRRAERDALLARVVNLLEGDYRVAAAWLIGSLGRGDGDAWSDIDLHVAIRDEFLEEVCRKRRSFVCALASSAPPILVLEAPHNAPAGGAYLLTLHAGETGPHEIDWYWQAASASQVPPDARLVVCRADHHPPLREVAQQAAAELTCATRATYFWAMAPIAAKKIARRQPWEALGMLAMLRTTASEVEHGCARGRRDLAARTPPACSPAAQMRLLRRLCRAMERHAAACLEADGAVPAPVREAVYHLFEAVDAHLAAVRRVERSRMRTRPEEST